MSDVPAPSGSPAPNVPASTTGETTSASGFFQAIHPERAHVESAPQGRRLAFLSLAALGVVYGDIGTSPLYALRQCLAGEYPVAATVENVYGVLSLIVWSLILVVSVKYIVFIMRADNRGEGGILALLALLLQQERRDEDSRRRAVLISLGLFGAALLYGDGVITPAISVLSAVEGLRDAAPSLAPSVVVAATVVILILLFSFQRFGTSSVGVLFGPIMTVWFVSIGILGFAEIVREPRIIGALNPWYGLRFLVTHGSTGFLILGAVVLAVTGAEALYADMGHFGKRPIRLAWFAVVLPALLLNYFGQGALILRNPVAASSPFYLLAPRVVLIPLIIVATLAAIVASQALISGAFSLMQQSVQLGYSPRVTIVHTSSREAGQIYVPEVNNLLMIGCLVIVLAFRSSSSLSAAYGIAVTGTMAITSLLYYVVARQRWGWSLWQSVALTTAFLVVDLAFFSANIIKVEHGGWVPLVMATGVFVLMSTWKLGRVMLHNAMGQGSLPLDIFLDDIGRKKPARVPGNAVFMSSVTDGVPVVLLHHLKHNKVLHETVILMSIVTTEVPEVPSVERIRVDKLQHGFWRIIARYGFMESPDVGDILNRARAAGGLKAKKLETTFYLGRERIIVARRGESTPAGARVVTSNGRLGRPLRMARWRKKLFVIMSRNARSATEFFGIPPNRVVELGAQVEL